MGISTHVLDTAKGKPAAGMRVQIARRRAEDWEIINEATTDQEGRVKNLIPDLQPGTYRLRFYTAAYNKDGFFPEVTIMFDVKDPNQHYHVPLLLSPFGYSTYRGS